MIFDRFRYQLQVDVTVYMKETVLTPGIDPRVFEFIITRLTDNFFPDYIC